jgi:hypothetical protein
MICTAPLVLITREIHKAMIVWTCSLERGRKKCLHSFCQDYLKNGCLEIGTENSN